MAPLGSSCGGPGAGPWRTPARPALWVAMLALARQAAGQFSLLNAGSECSDYYIPDVPSESVCFSTAQTAVGLAGVSTFRLDGAGFNGCVYNVEANLLMYGTSTQTVKLNSWRYVCNGVATTTTTTTVSTSTVTTTTVTLMLDGFSLINHFETCAEYKISDIDNVNECFDVARPFVGLASLPTLQLDGMGFTGCVYNTAGNLILFGNTSGVVGAVSSFYRYICRGFATTTTTTTETSTTSTTTTTVTTSTSTITTTTTITTTVTSTTSTLTTSTATTSTETTSTSTATTSTMTGSSSSTTTSTATTMTTETSTTWTSSTSTMTTITTTYTPPPPGAGFVGDDPLTIYGGVAKQFWLPEGELVQLLATGEMRLMGAAFNQGSEQWINRLVLTDPSGEPVMRVAVRGDIEHVRRDEVPADHFTTLNITLDWLGGVPLKAIPSPDSYAYTWGNVVFAFMRVPEFYIGEAQVEMMVIEGTSARIVIMSVAAPGFEGEGEAHLKARYAHLDFVLHLKEKGTCEGILPELWGLRPYSNDTLAMLEVPH